jgi:glycosyltransferase involved in cell wall biosynthesis
VHVLFFNEGNLGTHILGQLQLEASLRIGLARAHGVEARFARLAPMGRGSRALAERPLPLLAARNLDPRTARWHVVQSLRARAALSRALRAWPADVVLLHTQSIALAARRIMRSLPVALSVDTSIADWSAMPAWAATRGAPHATAPSRLLERRALRSAALVLAWTDWARRGIEREEPCARVVEHHPGIDLERFSPASRQARARPRVLFVGGRFAEKGGEDLLAALGDELGRGVELDLVTPAEIAPREGVRTHRLGPASPELVELYRQADVLCLPTYGDTNPWVLLEAMACGCAVVSTRVGAIPELLDDGRAGVLVDHGDRRGLRDALTALLDDPSRRTELGARARARCEARYDARRQFPALAEHLRQLVDDRAGGRV